MKRLLLAAAFVVALTGAVVAEEAGEIEDDYVVVEETSIEEDIQGMLMRREKMDKFLEKPLSPFGDIVIDGFIAHVYLATQNAMDTSADLVKLYYFTQGKDENGIPTENLPLPTVAEVTGLNDRILEQVEHIQGAAVLAKTTMDYAKSQKNPIKITKLIAGIMPATKLTPLLVNESAAQVKFLPKLLMSLKDTPLGDIDLKSLDVKGAVNELK